MELLEKLFEQGIRNPSDVMDAYLERGPVKMPLRKNVRRRVGSFPSEKMKGGVYFDGPEELKCVKYLEVLKRVRRFMNHPMVIDYFFDDKDREYRPDYLVEFYSGPLEIWEVKSLSLLMHPKFAHIPHIATQKLSLYDVHYKIMIDGEKPDSFEGIGFGRLPSGHEAENIDLMLRYQRRDVNELILALEKWTQGTSFTLGELKSGVIGRVLTKGDVFALIGKGYVSVNMKEKVDDEAKIHRQA